LDARRRHQDDETVEQLATRRRTGPPPRRPLWLALLREERPHGDAQPLRLAAGPGRVNP